MGCFDSFLLSEPMACPICGDATGVGKEFQTKDFGEHLQAFEVGDIVIFDGCLLLMDGMYSVYGSCRKCGAWIDADIVVSKGKFAGLANISAKSQKDKWAEGGR